MEEVIKAIVYRKDFVSLRTDIVASPSLGLYTQMMGLIKSKFCFHFITWKKKKKKKHLEYSNLYSQFPSHECKRFFSLGLINSKSIVKQRQITNCPLFEHYANPPQTSLRTDPRWQIWQSWLEKILVWAEGRTNNKSARDPWDLRTF